MSNIILIAKQKALSGSKLSGGMLLRCLYEPPINYVFDYHHSQKALFQL